jgi:hypothetical protein
MIRVMVREDLKDAEKDRFLEKEGFTTFHHFE